MTDYEVFELGDVELHLGVFFTSAKLAYKTFGTLTRGKDEERGATLDPVELVPIPQHVFPFRNR